MAEFEIEITDYGYDGEGVGHLDGKVVFVPYVLKGEVVKCRVTHEKSSFIQAKALATQTQSPIREVPPCPYFGRCGGCAYQHTAYQNELEIKRQILARSLAKVGYVGNVEVCPSQKEYGYRNKIHLFVGEKGLCLKERGSNKLVKVDKCLLVSEKINEGIFKIDTFLKNQNLFKNYKEVVLREEGGKLLINFILARECDINYQGLFLLVGDCGIFETYKGKTFHKVGLKELSSLEMGLDCTFDVSSFHQVNSYLTESLYQGVIDAVKGGRVANCYSGAGVLSGVIAKSGKEVVGIELGTSEQNDAEKLKIRNNLSSLTNICGDCGVVLKDLASNFDTIIVDPPRAGLDIGVCQSINASGAERLVYVSCNGATLVRDIGRLSGYAIEKVNLFDMFARTGEYEILCLLKKLG